MGTNRHGPVTTRYGIIVLVTDCAVFYFQHTPATLRLLFCDRNAGNQGGGFVLMDNIMKMIKLNHEKHAIVDDEDYEWLNQYRWKARAGKNTYYATRKSLATDEMGTGHTVFMHREILGLSLNDGKITDHKNRCGLDNRRSNLHTVLPSFNALNSARFHKTYASALNAWENGEGKYYLKKALSNEKC